nr:uncharacterized protein CFP56_05438 [Quercus suber]
MSSPVSSPALSLSREEQAELARSNKKVKNVNHAGFSESSDSRPPSPNQSQGRWSQDMSFKDKVVGEIPGAYTQAFNFGDLMEDDVESDDEVGALREGLVAVKFPRELKQKIRGPWARSLIVKVYERSVGFHFLHTRLLSLWKPVGRLDCVDLGHSFFLIRLSLKEDFEAVLKKGPWFIGDHFLSIRPWEPDFKPALANVSSIAVWIRLSELPIEYYNVEALHLIGKAIGNVLRVDTHTTAEARGRFARLCVQVDVTKPLVTAVLIGKLEQPVSYEGIHMLCFDCGRMGHRRENCPYSIRKDVTSQETTASEPKKDRPGSCNSHGTHANKGGVGYNEIVPEMVQENVVENVHDSTYGPWIVVSRKVKGVRSQRTNRGPLGQENELVRNRYTRSSVGKDKWANVGVLRGDQAAGPSRETKRKISPSKFTAEAQGVCTNTGLEGFKELRGLRLSGLSPKLTEIDSKREQGASASKPSPQASVKGKKTLARSKVSTHESGFRVESSKHQAVTKPFLFASPTTRFTPNGSAVLEASAKVLYSNNEGASMGNHLRGNCATVPGGSDCKNLGISESGLGLVHGKESMDDESSFDRSKCEEESLSTAGPCGEGSERPMVGVSVGGVEFEGGLANGLISHTHNSSNSDESADDSRMDLEGGGKASTSC